MCFKPFQGFSSSRCLSRQIWAQVAKAYADSYGQVMLSGSQEHRSREAQQDFHSYLRFLSNDLAFESQQAV